MGLNVLQFSYVPLHTEFLSDLYKKFQVASVYDTIVEYQIGCFCSYLFSSYTDNKNTQTKC